MELRFFVKCATTGKLLPCGFSSFVQPFGRSDQCPYKVVVFLFSDYVSVPRPTPKKIKKQNKK